MSVEEHYNGDGTDGSTIKMIKKTRAKMTPSTIREVLEELHCKAYEGSNSEDDVDQALSSIRQILEEGMPKKKSLQDALETKISHRIIFWEGFNQAISEIQQWIKEITK